MRGTGRAIFVATLLLIVGTLNIIYGIGSISDATAVVGDQRLVFTSLHTYGWALVIIGVIQLTAGHVAARRERLRPCAGNPRGGSIGALNALAAIGGRNPWWSLGAFALCIYILHGLIIFGRDERTSEQSRSLLGRNHGVAASERDEVVANRGDMPANMLVGWCLS